MGHLGDSHPDYGVAEPHMHVPVIKQESIRLLVSLVRPVGDPWRSVTLGRAVTVSPSPTSPSLSWMTTRHPDRVHAGACIGDAAVIQVSKLV